MMRDQLPELEPLQALYDACRYRDAYERTRDLWQSDAVALGLTVAETIFASRLAGRLGNGRISLALSRHAASLAPESPLVRYYCDARVGRRDALYLHLRDFLARPELASGDPEIDAAWLTSHAVLFARVRDFETAHRLADRARELCPDDGFVLAGRSSIASEEDERALALSLAEEAWARHPGHPVVVDALAEAIATTQSTSVAAARLMGLLDEIDSQSYHARLRVLALRLADAARSSGSERAEKARDVLARVPDLRACAPLADRRCTKQIAWVRAEAARIVGDRLLLREASREVGFHFYDVVARNLERSPEAERVVIPHPPIRQMHDTCLSASAATCLSAIGVAVDHDVLAAELTYGGAPLWRLASWAEAQGLSVRHFIVDATSAEALVRAGIPFVISFVASEWAHACAVVGIDFATRTMLVHDPSLDGLREVLLDEIGDRGAPLGPQGLVLATPERCAALAGIDLHEQAAQTARIAFLRDLDEQGIGRAAAAFEATPEIADSPVWEYVCARLLDARGLHVDALARLGRLVMLYPDCPELLGALSGAAYNTRDAATIREILRHIAERGRAPGLGPDSPWRHPPPVYKARYADLLAASAEHHERAYRLLLEALVHSPLSAECYHVLGDLTWEREGRDAALLPLRLASALGSTNEHYAVAYAHALWKCNRADEGIRWLRGRVERAGKAADAGPIVSLVETLVLFGRPVDAIAALSDACRDRPSDGGLASYAATVFARYGRHDESARALARVQTHGTPAEAFAAATEVARIEGRVADVRTLAARWVEELPTSMNAREVLLDAIEQQEGSERALAMAREWCAAHRDDDAYETLLLDRLTTPAAESEREQRLRAWVDRDPLNGWAWRELALLLLDRAQRASGERRVERTSALAGVVERCTAVEPGNATSQLLAAELARLQGDSVRAVVLLRECVREHPSYTFALRRLLDTIADHPIDERRRQVEFLRTVAQGASAHDLGFAAGVVAWIARAVGFDSAIGCLEQWSRDSPDEASIAEAWADLLLEHAGGRAVAQQVIERLRVVIDKYPMHLGLRQSLAMAYRTLGDQEGAVQVYAAIVHDFPGDARCRLGYARSLAEMGRAREWTDELQRAVDLAPRSPGLWHAWAELCVGAGDRDAAIDALERACAAMPHDPELLGHLAQELLARGRGKEALARVRARADGEGATAEHHALLARLLASSAIAAGIGEIERALYRALELDPGNWDAAREYCDVLCDRERWQDARAVLEHHLSICENPVVVRGHLALLSRRSGEKERAVRELRTLLESQPEYGWGWQTLMQWAREDESLGIAREVLASVSRLRVDPGSRADGLDLLAHFRVDDAGVRTGWRALVAEHPASLEVALRAFDYFFAQGELAEAESVLVEHHRHLPFSSRARARLVQLRCAQLDRARAMEDARALWTTGAHDDDRSAMLAMSALSDAGMAAEVGKAMRADLAARGHVTRAMAIQLCHALRNLRLTQDLARVVKAFEKHDHPYGGEVLGYAFDGLCALGRYESAISFRALHPTRAASDPDIWMAVGQAYSDSGRHAEACDWLWSWETRSGVTMWAVGILVRSASVLGRWADVRRAAEAAFARLPRDHTAGNIALHYLVALLHCEDLPVFARVFDELGSHLDVEMHGELTVECLQAIRTLQAPDATPAELRLLDRRVSELAVEVGEQKHFLVQTWRRLLIQRLGGWRRVARALGFW